MRRARVIAWLFPLGSLAVLLGAAAVVNNMTRAEFLARLGSPIVVLLFCLLALIYIPATIRIYYVMLLDAKGVFTAAQRQKYRECKQLWEKLLLKAALIAGVGLVVLGVWLTLTRLSH